MTEPKIDPERLAALLDGRLDEQQRAEVMAQLAESPETLEAYADAVAVVRELESAERPVADAGVIPLRKSGTTRGWRVAQWQWLAAAAVIAGIAVIPLVWRGGGRAVSAAGPGDFVAALASENAGLPAGWNGRPWSTTRAATDPLTPEARAVRVGARLVDLELAVRARDTAAAKLASELATLLDEIPASGPIAALYRDLATRASGPPEASSALFARGRDAAARLAGEDFANVGAWAEAARFAAARHDVRFFRSRPTRTVLERTTHVAALAGRPPATLARTRAFALGDGAADWNAIEEELTAFLRAIAS